MSGTLYRVTCSRCYTVSEVEIYDDWFAIPPKFDCSEAVCLDCAREARPEVYYTHQCIGCHQWFNAGAYPGGFCHECAIRLLDASRGRVGNDA